MEIAPPRPSPATCQRRLRAAAGHVAALRKSISPRPSLHDRRHRRRRCARHRHDRRARPSPRPSSSPRWTPDTDRRACRREHPPAAVTTRPPRYRHRHDRRPDGAPPRPSLHNRRHRRRRCARHRHDRRARARRRHVMRRPCRTPHARVADTVRRPDDARRRHRRHRHAVAELANARRAGDLPRAPTAALHPAAACQAE